MKAMAALLALALAGCAQTVPPVLENGTVLAAVPANQAGTTSGEGAAIGAVVLGAAGGAAAQGAGQALAVLGGAIVGAAAGQEAEAENVTHNGIAYTIRLDDGRVITVLEHLDDGEAVFNVGAAVTLQTIGSQQVVLARKI